ncbi:MAG: phosphonopyruvate decarboxylase [Bacteroidota bacterium]
MIDAAHFIDQATAAGFDFYAGVPCSFLTPLINRVIGDRSLSYFGATSEGEAIGIAAGAWLAGRSPVVMCQNSGLGNMVNPLTSLNWPFRIPILLIITWRGQPGLKDEPQHALMGGITHDLLTVIAVAHRAFPRDSDEIVAALAEARAAMSAERLPFALIMERGVVADEQLRAPTAASAGAGQCFDLTEGGEKPSRAAVLERFLADVPASAAVVATTGRCGRELFTLADREQHLYQVGSMGCASAMGLGIACNVDRPVVVLDGDGAALMKLGNLATIGAFRPRNLVHLLLDNGVHDSTGGQPTVSAGVGFAAIAAACGYARAFAVDSLAGARTSLAEAFRGEGPTFIHARIKPGSISPLGRPTIAPVEVADRFRSFLCGANRSPRLAAIAYT